MKRKNQAEYIQKFKKVHGERYDYSKFIYINNSTKGIIICSDHGEFLQVPNLHARGNGCPYCGIDRTNNSKRIPQEEIIKRFIEIHGNKYDYSKVIYTGIFNKITIRCTVHGDFKQAPNHHLEGSGCPICWEEKINLSIRSNKLIFEKYSRIVHSNKYDYSKVDYKHSKIKVKIKCLKEKHGYFYQTPNNHLRGQGCPKCKSSIGEETIKIILDKHNIKYQQEWKFPDKKYRYRYDFYLLEHNLLIEFHGKQHFEWIPFFHKTYDIFKKRQEDDLFKKSLAWDKRIPMLEFNYNQLKYLTDKQFENLLIGNINKFKKKG